MTLQVENQTNNPYECPKCHKENKSTFDAWCIKKSGRCVDCQKAWEALPENDPNLKKFIIEYENNYEDETTIYAENEAAARRQFEDNFSGEFTDIKDVREVKK